MAARGVSQPRACAHHVYARAHAQPRHVIPYKQLHRHRCMWLPICQPTASHSISIVSSRRSLAASSSQSTESPPVSTGPSHALQQLATQLRTEDVSQQQLTEAFRSLVTLSGGMAPFSDQDQLSLADALVSWTTAAQPHLERITVSTRGVASVLGALAGVARRQPLAAATPEGREQVVGFVLQLLQGVRPHLPSGTPSEYLYILTGAAMFAPARADPSFLSEVEAATYPKLLLFSADQLATCIWALDKLAPMTGWRPGAEWLLLFLNQSIPKLPQFSTTDLAATLAALARFEAFPSEQWLDAVIELLRQRAPTMSPGEQAMISYAVEALGIPLDKLTGTER